MSAASTTIQAPATQAVVYAQPTPIEIDRSVRAAGLFLFAHAIFWLVISSLLAVIASVKLHGPGMFASMPGLSYGRIASAASATFLYGFASQAAMGVALWLLARLGRTLLQFGGGAIVGGIFWNLGVLVGTFGIFYGAGTGYDRFEFPIQITPILFIGYALVGISGLVTYHTRSDRDTYPSVWFILAALFAFPWVYSIATLLLGEYAVRGPMTPIVAIWFGNNFITMWLAPVALGVIFYLVAKLSGQALHSYGMAAFAFWGYVFLAHATGFQSLHSVPGWLPALSTVINTFLMPIVILALVWNWVKTWSGHGAKAKERAAESKYVFVSMVAFTAAGILLALLSFFWDSLLGFSIFQLGLGQLVTHGFIAMALFAGITHIVPRLTDIDWPVAKFTSMHYSLTVVGIGLSVLALVLGGFIHGGNLNNPQVSSVQVIKKAIPFIGMSTLGLVIFLGAQVLLLGNLAAMLRVCCCTTRKEVAR